MTLQQFIDQLSTDMGYEQPLESNDDGSYSLRLEPDLDINVKENADDSITMSSSLAQLPSHNSEEFLLKAMIANLLGRETGRAALGIDPEGKQVVLVDFIIDVQGYRAFRERLEEFANYAEAWRQETKEFIEQHVAEE